MFKSHCAILHGFVLLKRKPLLCKWEDDADKWKTPWDGEVSTEKEGEIGWVTHYHWNARCLISINSTGTS